MNYLDGDYILGHIQRKMLELDINKLEINLLSKEAYPQELVTLPIQQAINHYAEWFPKMSL
jgi:hypothetical protein